MSWCIDDEDKKALETCIPELAESEDEKVRKEIISALKFANDGGVYDKHIAYLEKQKDVSKEYWRGYREGKQEILDKYAEIEKQKDQKSTEWSEDDEKIRKGLVHHLQELREWKVGEMVPIKTPEHYDAWITYLEMQKEIDVLDEEEREFADNVDSFRQACDEAYQNGFNQGVKSTKPAEWSEEDEKMLDSIVNVLEVMPSANFIPIKRETMIPWLKSLLERFNLQPKQEWSEDDESFLDSIEEAISSYYDLNHAPQYHYWLEEKLNPRPQPNTVPLECATKFGNLEYERGVKDGIQHSENHCWKPSEEQMEALKNSAYGSYQNGDGPVLRELYNDLLKNCRK